MEAVEGGQRGGAARRGGGRRVRGLGVGGGAAEIDAINSRN
jgi:hypothetical protein